MSMSDPLADMLTRIRNAQVAGHKTVAVPQSRLKWDVARILKAEGYIADFATEGGTQKQLTIYLKYAEGLEPAIRGLKRESRGGLRKYCNASEIPKVLGGLGVAILSTSSGVMTGREARQKNVGGEVLCSVW
jgi:small subunit ribosomal protein S8